MLQESARLRWLIISISIVSASTSEEVARLQLFEIYIGIYMSIPFASLCGPPHSLNSYRYFLLNLCMCTVFFIEPFCRFSSAIVSVCSQILGQICIAGGMNFLWVKQWNDFLLRISGWTSCYSELIMHKLEAELSVLPLNICIYKASRMNSYQLQFMCGRW